MSADSTFANRALESERQPAIRFGRLLSVCRKIEEERRLLYVAMTRARDFLYLVHPLRFFRHQQPALSHHGWSSVGDTLTYPKTHLRTGRENRENIIC